MGKLVLFLADGTTLDIPLEQARLTVGRRANNDVCLPYAAVSGEHALFVIVPTGVVVEDLGSTNGTIVNGKRVARQFLHDGDRVEIGRQKFVYMTDVAASVGPAHPAPKVERRRHSDRSARAGGGDVTRDTAPVAEAVVEAKSPDALNDAAAAPPPAVPVEAAGPEADHPRADFVAMGVGEGIAFVPDADIAAPPASPPPADMAPAGPHLWVVTGANAGRYVEISKDEVLIGRIGVQVVAVRRSEEAVRVARVEGDAPVHINGVPIPAEGSVLQPGDMVELAGVRLEYRLLDTVVAG